MIRNRSRPGGAIPRHMSGAQVSGRFGSLVAVTADGTWRGPERKLLLWVAISLHGHEAQRQQIVDNRGTGRACTGPLGAEAAGDVTRSLAALGIRFLGTFGYGSGEAIWSG